MLSLPRNLPRAVSRGIGQGALVGRIGRQVRRAAFAARSTVARAAGGPENPGRFNEQECL